MANTRSKDAPKATKSATAEPAVAATTTKASSKAKAKAPAAAAASDKKDSKKRRAAEVEGPEAAAAEEEEVAEEEDEDEEEAEGEWAFDGSDDEDGADSSDEEEEGNMEPFKVEALPAVASKDALSVQKKLEAKAERRKNAKSGTIYLGRIPHGFHEEEMKSYFSQFGEVTRLRLSRNKKTGASKHYGFVEFAYASVAQIVQETMDNYLLAGHILVCKVIPDNEIHPKLWIGANRKYRPVPTARLDRLKREAPKSDEQKEKVKKRLLSREQAKRNKLEKLGIEYDFSGYAGKVIEDTPATTAEEKAAVKGKKSGKKAAIEPKAAAEKPTKKKARKSA